MDKHNLMIHIAEAFKQQKNTLVLNLGLHNHSLHLNKESIVSFKEDEFSVLQVEDSILLNDYRVKYKNIKSITLLD